jgi:hypothetical protein
MVSTRYRSPEEHRLRRQHVRWDGTQKNAYPTAEGARVAAKATQALHPGSYMTVYQCGLCDRWHVGNDKVLMARFFDALRIEVGGRATHNLARENSGTAEERIAVIVKRGRRYRRC